MLLLLLEQRYYFSLLTSDIHLLSLIFHLATIVDPSTQNYAKTTQKFAQ